MKEALLALTPASAAATAPNPAFYQLRTE